MGHYYKRAHVRTLFNKLDNWIERRIWSHRYKCWRNCGWKQLPKRKLYGEYGLVQLVKLIPSIASQKRVPGRKTDVSDCQWLQYLHSVGLLKASFRPGADVCAVRSLLRHRDSLVELASQHVQHMQKSFDQMNLQLHHVISDLTGTTGLAIVDTILGGERDGHKLAALCDPRIRASKDTIAKSLVGDYRAEHLFTLKQSLNLYRQYQKEITNCESEIQRFLKRLKSTADPAKQPLPPAKDSIRRCKVMTPASALCLREEAYRVLGVDLTTIPGLSVLNVQTIIAEVGPDLSRFRSAAAFSSWLGLCPDNSISGGKVLKTATRKVKFAAISSAVIWMLEF